MTTTIIGTWTNRVHTYSLTIGQWITDALGEVALDFDIDAIEADFRAEFADALPAGVRLCGEEFIADVDYTFDPAEYPTDENGGLDLKAIADSIDFWEIASRHDNTI
ncbi:hypothetical protein [Nocardia farcinica]|uniref:hypothetical protein n=1 Tax=Nocardia farcinica TaxID=37329 RepID=UPI002456EDAC|nr:hypothetical protein [Nocardia farcinica]